MTIKEIAKKVSELVWTHEYNGVIYFEPSSYDLEEDIPHITIDDKRIIIDEVRFGKHTNDITIVSGDDSYTLNFDTAPYTDEEYEDMGMYELLSDTYYNTAESWEIGDFELDFLNI